MLCYRRMMRIKWIDRVSNEEVLRRVGEKSHENLNQKTEQPCGHILRHDGLMKTILEGQLEGKNGKGRPGTKYMEQVKKDVKEKKYAGVKRLVDRRIQWRAASNQS